MLTKKLWILVLATFAVHSLTYAQSPGNTTPKTIVVLGSSTSYGYLASPVDSSYVGRLKINLRTYHRGDTLINLGYPGYTTYEIQPTGTIPSPDTGTIAKPDTARNITKALKYKPDLVIINMPTNDIDDNYTDTQSLNNYQTVVNMLIAAHVQYIITSTQPRNFSAVQRARLRPFTNLLLSTFPGHVVDYLDQLSNSNYTIRDSLSGGDGIHVNNKGHKIIYNNIVNFPLYKQLVNFTQVISCNNFGPSLYGAIDYVPSATCNSNLPLSIISSNANVATIVNGKIHVITTGTSTITFAQAGNTNYAAAPTITRMLVVKPAALTITATNQTRAYGAVNPKLSISYTGYVNGDTYLNLTQRPQVITDATLSSSVGSYPITVASAADSNYAISYVPGNLSITPALLTIKPADITRLYGASNGALPLQYTGFVNGDDTTKLTARAVTSTTAVASSPAGVYPISASGAASPNYTFTYAAGNLTVSPAPLTIKANNETKIYGKPNPALDISYSGFVNGDDSTKLTTLPVASTNAIDSSPVGNYPITISGAVDPNYAINYVPGTLVINPIPLPVISSFSPASGMTGTTITITGTNFDNASAVSFGATPAASFTVVSPTTITAVVGAGTSGNVTVTTPGGTVNDAGFNYVFDLPASNFKLAITSATCKGNSDGLINVTAAQSLNYTATITGNGLNTSYPFTTTLDINNLTAGTYNVCITVADQPSYSQCFDAVITEPKDLSVYSTIDNTGSNIVLNLDGGNQYNIQLNGVAYNTNQSSITLPLKEGNNDLSVTTDRLCQGIFRKVINASGKITPYPVPFQNTLSLNLGNSNVNNVNIEIHNVSDGKLVYSKQYINQSGVLQFDTANLPNGVYAFHLSMDHTEKIFKIIKQ